MSFILFFYVIRYEKLFRFHMDLHVLYAWHARLYNRVQLKNSTLLFLGSYFNSKNGVKKRFKTPHFFGVILTPPILTPEMELK